MTYFEHTDKTGRNARIRVEINHAERAKAALPFEGTLYMSKHAIRSRCLEARLVDAIAYAQELAK